MVLAWSFNPFFANNLFRDLGHIIQSDSICEMGSITPVSELL